MNGHDANQKRHGQNLRSVLNDIKRTLEAAADELDVPIEEMEAYVAGEKPIPEDVIQEAASTWPINERDLHIVKDDAPEGLRLMSSSESEELSRVFSRGGEDYYEYRDTAMSRLSMFRPEWIRELCVVEDDNPENERVQWNNGHFMHQFTYFIGPVNFYYEVDGEKRVARMSTGDSMYITPFVRHSFATRANDEGREGLILAVTCGSKLLGGAQQELSAVGVPWARQYFLDADDQTEMLGKLVRYHRRNSSIPTEELAARADVTLGRLKDCESGKVSLDNEEIVRIADALKVNVRDLLPQDEMTSKVVTQMSEESRSWTFSDEHYQIRELATTRRLPHARPIELTVRAGVEPTGLDLEVGLHQWGYNVSDRPVTIRWETTDEIREEQIEPGDSFYLKPFVQHTFTATDEDASLLLMRLGGRMSGDPMRELSAFDESATERAVQETMQWFDEEGSS